MYQPAPVIRPRMHSTKVEKTETLRRQLEAIYKMMRDLKTQCVCTICPEDYGNGECQCKRDPNHPYYEL